MSSNRQRRGAGLMMMTVGVASAMVLTGAIVQPQIVLENPTASPLKRHVVVTSPFGVRSDPIHRSARMHEGVDLRSPHGQEVTAAAEGLVIQAADAGDGRGNCVRILHPDGRSTVYAHLADTAGAMLLSWVRAGQLIGHVGSTGRSTGPHLHFEVRSPVGLSVDPMPLLADLGVSWWVVPQPPVDVAKAVKAAKAAKNARVTKSARVAKAVRTAKAARKAARVAKSTQVAKSAPVAKSARVSKTARVAKTARAASVVRIAKAPRPSRTQFRGSAARKGRGRAVRGRAQLAD